jgi:hypothetical protein
MTREITQMVWEMIRTVGGIDPGAGEISRTTREIDRMVGTIISEIRGLLKKWCLRYPKSSKGKSCVLRDAARFVWNRGLL